MCGIGGVFRYKLFTSKKEKEEICKVMAKLLLGLQNRGRDATGIALVNTHTNDFHVYKLPVKASKLIRKKRFRQEFLKRNYNVILMHTRMPTVGDTTNINNHPIFDTEHNNVMVHNGGITNYEELRKKYQIDGNAEVDSEVILAMFNHKKKIFKDAVKELAGGMAIALYDRRKLNFYSKDRPLNISYFPKKNMWMFSSEEKFIEAAIKKKEVIRLKDLWEFDDILPGYEKRGNYQFADKEMFEIVMNKKKRDMEITHFEGIECASYYKPRNNQNVQSSLPGYYRGQNRKRTDVHMNICDKCLCKHCKDRHTSDAMNCKDKILDEHVIDRVGSLVQVKDRGWKPLAIFDHAKLKEIGMLNAEQDADELALQGPKSPDNMEPK